MPQMDVTTNFRLTNRRRDENLVMCKNIAVICNNDKILDLQQQIDNMKINNEKEFSRMEKMIQ